MANQYPVQTLLDVARLPEDAFPRFIKELPEMIAMLRKVDAYTASAISNADPAERGKLREINDATIIQSLTWVDDGRTDMRVNVEGKTPDGKTLMKIEADSRTRDVHAEIDGRDITAEMILIARLAQAGFNMEDQSARGRLMPDGKLAIPADRLPLLSDMTPAALEMAHAANRELRVTLPDGFDPENIAPGWRSLAET